MTRSDNKKVTIGGYNFYIYPFGAMRSANISGELVGFASPLIAAIISLIGGTDGNNESGSILDMDIEDAAKFIVPAFRGINGDTVEKLLRMLLIKYRNISFDTDEDKTCDWLDENDLDKIFVGQLQNMYMLAWEVIKLNYGGFFDLLSSQSGNQEKLLGAISTLRTMEN